MALLTDRFVNLVIAFVNILLLLFHTSAVKPTAPQLDLSDYELTFCDEFDGDSLDSSVWHTHGAEGVRKGGYWVLDAARVSDGDLIITTNYRPDGKFGAGWYTCALDTCYTFEQKYGYFECRCILPKGTGLWSAFWLTNQNLGLTEGNALKGAEIDVFESPFYYLGGKAKNKVTSNIHYNGYGLKTRYSNVAITSLDNDPYENYNTYGVLWTEDEYTFYINGYKIGSSTFGGVSQEKEYMILSCEVDGGQGTPTLGWSGIIDTNDKATFSSEFKVDYVKVYAKK